MSGQEANIVSSLIDGYQQARKTNVGCREGAHLYLLQKFCVTLTVWSRFRTLCHQPLGMNTMSPGFCTHSMGRLLFYHKNKEGNNQQKFNATNFLTSRISFSISYQQENSFARAKLDMSSEEQRKMS